ncbi:DUF6701 domain-containing protein [Saccharospirillum salsuginis]|uniref:DUF6701 domain-containing protein n=1 Tax=Saccharospirillum salsuginis TaxID=418750 RepID=A0A918K3Q6_9GAMM|nr:DUF6701 domain-containing protein [Saccharospirillum salsuginis]GGX45590.1 hypothetical protein GCM10007392_10780 [Saccharospirillum salsuginis]
MALLLLMGATIQAATYTLPSSTGPFNNCTVNGGTMNCSGNLSLGNGDTILLNQDVFVEVNQSISIGNNFEVNTTGDYSLTFYAHGNINVGNSLLANTTLRADGSISVGNSATITGDIQAGGAVNAGNNANINGDITAGGNLSLGNGSTVNGTCSASSGNYPPYCSASLPATFAYFPLNEDQAWNGAAGEIDDMLGNANVARAIGNAQNGSVDGASACRGGQIPLNTSDNQDALDTGIDLDASLGNTGTISFWYLGNSSSGDRQLVDASQGDKYFHLTLNGSGAPSFRMEDSSDDDFQADSGTGLDTTQWHHFTITWDLNADEINLYVDGSLVASDSFNSNNTMPNFDTVYFGDNRSGYVPGTSTNDSANGWFDDIRFFNDVLDASEVQTVRDINRDCTTPTPPNQCFDFEDGSLSGWSVNSSGGDAGVNTDTGSNALFTQGGEVAVTSPIYDTTAGEVTVSMTVQRGDDAFSEDPDNNEDLEVGYLNSSGTWVTLETFTGSGTPGEVFDRTYTLPANARHNGFQLRIRQTAGNNGDFDYWHIDDICISIASSATPIREYRFDETTWSGTSGEVVDSIGGLNGTALNSAVTVDPGQICRAGDLSGNNVVQVPELSELRTTASLSFWIKTTAGYTGNNTSWAAPAVTGVEESGGGDDIFWGWIDASGRIGITKGNTNDARSSTAINTGNFHHIVLTWDHTSGASKVYVDGQLEATGTTEAGSVTNTFDQIGAVPHTNGNNTNYLDAELDEVLIYDQILTDSQVSGLYDLQNNGRNLDDTVRSCPTDATCVTDNFNRSDLGSDWAVTERSSSSDYLPGIVNGRLRITPAVGYISTAATLMRLFPSAGNRVEVEFDYYAYGGGSNGADGVTLAFSDSQITPQPGSFGGSLGYAQRNGSDNVGFAGGWVGIGLDEYGNFLTSNEGRQGGFSSRVRETVTIRGEGSDNSGYNYITSNGIPPGSSSPPSSLSPSVQNSNGHRYRIIIDHSNGTNAWLTVERDTNNDGTYEETVISQFDMLDHNAGIPNKMYLTITGSTGGSNNNHEIDNFSVCANTIEPVEPQIHHYELERQTDQGLTCEPLPITVRACLDENCTTQVSDPVDTTFTPSDGWVGGAAKTGYNSGSTFDFVRNTTGTSQLGVSYSSPSIAPLSTEPVQCYLGAAKQPDCNVDFVNAAFQFFDGNIPGTPATGVFDLVAGAASSDLYIRAVRTDPDTGVCQPAFPDGTTVDLTLGTTCTQPGSCASGQQVSWNSTPLPNPENPISGSSTQSVPVTFQGNSTASFQLTSPDVGVQTLSAESPPMDDADGNPTGDTITGAVSIRTRPDRLSLIDLVGSHGNNDGSSKFEDAGRPFSLALEGLDINGNATASFGRLAGDFDIDWGDTTLNGPTGGNLGDLIGDSLNTSSSSQWQDGGARLILPQSNGLSYHEVGSISLVATLTDFLGSGETITSQPQTTGRFVPAYLDIAPTAASYSWGSTGSAYQGYTESMTNITVNVRSYDIDGDPLNNYDGSAFNWSPLTNNWLSKPGTLAGTGDTLESTLTWSIGDNGDFDGVVTLSASDIEVLWNRSSGAGTPDNDDTPQTVSEFFVSEANLTDSDGVCYQLSVGGACQPLTLNLTDRTLYYARARLPEFVDASSTDAFIPVELEYLSGFDSGDALFTLQTSENTLDSAVFMGLTHSGTDYCPSGEDTTCQAVADSASFSGPDGTGSTLSGGAGLFSVSAPSAINHNVGVTLDTPDWLHWDWDGEPLTQMSDSSTLILFGNYQGRPPILFTRPGYR